MANQTMERALTFAGYEVNHAWGDGGHNGKHAAAIFPDVMRWLWQDWPQPVKGSQTKKPTLTNILIAGEGWQPGGEGDGFTESPGGNAKGEGVFNGIPTGKNLK